MSRVFSEHKDSRFKEPTASETKTYETLHIVACRKLGRIDVRAVFALETCGVPRVTREPLNRMQKV